MESTAQLRDSLFSNSGKTAIAVAKKVQTMLRYVQRLFKKSKTLVRKRYKRKPVLNSVHKLVRMAFGQNDMSRTEQ